MSEPDRDSELDRVGEVDGDAELDKDGVGEALFEAVVDVVTVADGVGEGDDNVTLALNNLISLEDNDRLYTRRSLTEPEKSSPAVLTGVRPFQPIRRVEVDKDEMANVKEVDDATLTPSIKAVSVLVDDEPV